MSFRWLVVLLFPLALQAAPMETMAWHFPTRPWLGFLEEEGEAITDPAVGKSPEITVFTHKDQPVTDFSGPFRRHFNLGVDSWLIWNESRKLLVARSIPVVLWQIEDETNFAKQSQQAQVTFSWFQGIEPGKPIPSETNPIHQSTVIARSGHRASQSWSTIEPVALSSSRIDVTPTFADEDSAVDLSFKLNWLEKSSSAGINWSYNASMALDVLSVPKRICVQTDSRSGQSWTVSVEGSMILMDGFPKAKSKLCELDGKEVVLENKALPSGQGRRTQLQTKTGPVTLVVFSAPSDFLTAISGMADVGGEVDPFAPQPGAAAPSESRTAKSIFIPADLKFSLPRNLLEANVEPAGIKLSPGGFIGFEPTHCRLYAVGLKDSEFDMLEQLVSGGCYRTLRNLKVSEVLEAISKDGIRTNRRAVLLSRSGGKSVLTSSIAKDREVEKITVEPTIGDSDELVDLHYISRFVFPGFESNSNPTLPTGIQVVGSALKLEGGETLTQSWKASIMSVHDPD